MIDKVRSIIALCALCMCAPLAAAQEVATSQEPPDKTPPWQTLNAMADRREPALLFKLYIFEPPRSSTTYEIYCTGMAYSTSGVFGWSTHYSSYVLLNLEQLRQIKGLTLTLPAATASATDYSPAERYKRAIVVTMANGGYKRLDYRIWQTPTVLSQIIEIMRAGRVINQFSGPTPAPTLVEEVCPEYSEANFDEEGASRERLIERIRERHLYPARRRRAVEVYLRRFYNENDIVDGYLKKAVEKSRPQ